MGRVENEPRATVHVMERRNFWKHSFQTRALKMAVLSAKLVSINKTDRMADSIELMFSPGTILMASFMILLTTYCLLATCSIALEYFIDGVQKRT